MEYFEELALGPLCPIPTPWWKRYVDDVICIVKKHKVDILFNHINQMDPCIQFTMEPPDSEGNIPFLGTKCSLNPNNTICNTLYKKPTHTDRYLDWNSNHPIFAKSYTSITKRARMVCFTPELLAKEMDYLHRVLHRHNYPDWFLKKTTIPRTL